MKSNSWDSVLDWGELLFGKYVDAKGANRNVSGLLVPRRIRNRSVAGRVERVNQLMQNTLKRSPEVIVKISGSGKGMSQISAHFDYISRNGNLQVENERAEIINGSPAMADLKNEWRYGYLGIPENGRLRESLNVVLSMPPGTNRESMLSAVRDFSSLEFSENHQFVFVAHNDEAHPHIHLCVKVLGIDGTRLNPRKADLQRWRESFADRLRAHGIDANATPRKTRGVIKKARSQAQIHSNLGNKSQIMNLDSSEIMSKEVNERKIDRKVVKAFEKIAHVLASSEMQTERQTALSIVSFIKRMPALHQVLEATELQNIKRKQEEEVAQVKQLDNVSFKKDTSRSR